MTKIANPPPSSRIHTPGVDCFRAIIKARLDSVGAKHGEVFEKKSIETDLIKLSGGQPTELMTLMREAMIADDLPIKSAGLRRCREETLRTYRRQLRPDHWPVLEQARATGPVTRTEENERPFRELLESRALLLYRNDDEWYALNPAVEGIEPPKATPVPTELSTED